MQNMRAYSRVLSARPQTPGNRTLMETGRDERGVLPIIPRESRRREKEKKSPASRDPPRKSRWRLSAGSARFLKIFSLFFLFYSLLLLFRLIVENVRRTKMMSCGTLDTLSYFRLACRALVCSATFRFRSFSFPSHDSFLRTFFHREWEMNGEGECRRGGCVEGLILFHLLSFLLLAWLSSPPAVRSYFRISFYIENV